MLEELTRAGVTVSAWHGRLALSPNPPYASAWALDIWTAPEAHAIISVKAAADMLRASSAIGPPTPALHHRRMALIEGHLPPVRPVRCAFPEPAPTSHLGAWTLLDRDRLLASPTKSSPFPLGECRFEEDHIGPPSRAYLKLWEALTRLGAYPGPGRQMPRPRRITGWLDLGAGQSRSVCAGGRQGTA